MPDSADLHCEVVMTTRPVPVPVPHSHGYHSSPEKTLHQGRCNVAVSRRCCLHGDHRRSYVSDYFVTSHDDCLRRTCPDPHLTFIHILTTAPVLTLPAVAQLPHFHTYTHDCFTAIWRVKTAGEVFLDQTLIPGRYSCCCSSCSSWKRQVYNKIYNKLPTVYHQAMNMNKDTKWQKKWQNDYM